MDDPFRENASAAALVGAVERDQPALGRPARRWFVGSLEVGLLIVLLVRILVRDRYYPLAVLFYATPWPVLAAGAALVSALRYQRRQWGRSCADLAVALACLIWWFGTGYGWRPGAAGPTRPPDAIRLVSWNALSGNWCTDETAARLLEPLDADIIVLVEGYQVTPQTAPVWERRFPGYQVLALGEGLATFVRGSARLTREESDARRGRLRFLEVEIRGQPFEIVVVDLLSELDRPRQHAFAWLQSMRQERTGRPVLFVGDFNTPPDSVCFDDWRPDWTSAWESAGRGWATTWPMPLPVLTLDQAWGNRFVRFASAKLIWTWASDHRLLVVDLTLTP